MKITCIPNGFDRLNLPKPAERDKRFVIMHLGDFYGRRTPDRLLDALSAIDNSDIEFVQVGPVFDSYSHYRERVAIRLIERVPRGEALNLMRSASLLYLCQGHESDVSEYIAVAAKTYEYLATGLPILADCPPGDNADLVGRFAVHSYVVTNHSAKTLEAAVRDAMSTSRHVRPSVDREFVRLFNREAQAEQLAAIFVRVSRDSTRSGV
jgi:hypothetical protein